MFFMSVRNCVSIFGYLCVRKCVFACVFVCSIVYTCVCVFVNVCVCVRTYTYVPNSTKNTFNIMSWRYFLGGFVEVMLSLPHCQLNISQ